jgi:hypothetical protein
VTNFLAEGGEAFPTFTKGGNRAETGIRDIDALTDYLVKREQASKPAGRRAAGPHQAPAIKEHLCVVFIPAVVRRRCWHWPARPAPNSPFPA